MINHTNTSSKPRRILLRLLAARNSNNFTVEEVRQRLRNGSADEPRTAIVQAAASRTGVWSARLTKQLHAELGRTAERLPTIVFWYRQGMSASEIGRRLSLFGDAWDAERALEVAAALIARSLNDGDFAELAA